MKGPKPVFVERIYAGPRRITVVQIDLFVYRVRDGVVDEPLVEISMHATDQRHVTSFLEMDDAEALIAALRKAIDLAKRGEAP